MERSSLMNDPIRDGAFMYNTFLDDFLHGRSASNRLTSRTNVSSRLATGDPRTLSAPAGSDTLSRGGCRSG
jgi:hypothetical protein